ncbi:unnamed protein product [Allacma fusca]|uniref:Ribosomal protein S9 n=1 Tax=Allacma fusca TaxID=39272 RepID=A0A8J2Q6L6_9HEXA|nr:unnamed protein product [Allacma fusca]
MSLIWNKLLLECSLTRRINCRSISTGLSFSRNQIEGNKSEGTSTEGEQRGSISKAMQSYIERAKAHSEFMNEQHEEFNLGRRHLANMMGKDPETFSQDDVNEAIRYLFPSGLFQTKARPMMRPPEELYPKQKAAEFDASGRPYHAFFYTGRPFFFQMLHEMVNKIMKLNLITGVAAELKEESTSFINGTVWIGKEVLENRLFEKITDVQYSEWMNTLERIITHRHVEREIEYLKQFRVPLARTSLVEQVPPVLLQPDGSKVVTVERVAKKRCRGDITVRMPGTGEIIVNGETLEYFKMVQSREMVISPLQKAGLLGAVDVDARVEGSGETSQAGVVRRGIALGIVALGAESEPLRLAGYLTFDRRNKERNKPGHDSARKKWTWKKR